MATGLQLRLGLDQSPALPVHRVRAMVPSVESPMPYESGSQGRRTFGWRPPTASPNTAVLYALTTLRDRSRAATRNNGWAKGSIDHLVANIVGTGVKPVSQADDPAFREQVQTLWLRWTDESDADGLLDWYGQQTQAVRAWLEGGETFVRLRPRLLTDGLSVPLQIQVIEPELCPHTHNAVLPKWRSPDGLEHEGNRVRAGIEFDAIGRRVAYWFYTSRPGDLQDFDASQLRRIPADSVVHLYDPLRPGQLRGLPHLTQALVRLHELDKYDDAVLLRQQLANLFAGFVTRPPNTLGDPEAIHPLTGLPTESDDEGRPMLSLEPGIFQELGPGEEITFSDPPDAGTGYADFIRQQLFHVAAATGVPYEILTGDMAKVNDRTVRVILHEFRRRVQAWQHQIVVYQLCRRVWSAWLDRVFLSGALPIPAAYRATPEPWRRATWSPQGWPYLQPVQDVQAKCDAIRAGLSTRRAEVSELGEDAEAIDAIQAADNARADGLGLVYDSDPRRVSRAGLTQARAAGSEIPTADTGTE